MPARFSCRTGIYMQTFNFFVKHHLQDMRMTSDKEHWRLSVDIWFYVRRISTRITPNMRHPNIHLFAVETKVLRKPCPDLLIIYIPVNPFKRFKCSQGLRNPYPKISCMPYFIAFIEIFKYCIVQKTMRIRQKAYCFHLYMI